jgi:Zn-dependent alcohol dehydrogenase
MKAAVCYEFGKPLVVEEVEIAPPQKGEVRVRIVATGICHSDIHLIEGAWGGKVPVIAGHEAAGIVDQIGDGVTLAQPGDRVVVSLLRSCGRCLYCTTGAPHLCEARFALDTENRLHDRHGQPIRQGIRTAAFAEYVVVDQSQVMQVPEEVPLDRAALLACGVITGFGAVVNTARVAPGQSVVVIGVGGVGLNAIQGAALCGAHPVIAVDLLDSKLQAARTFGATHVLNAEPAEETAAKVMDLTAGRGADYVFVAVGSSAAIVQGLGLMSKRRGTLVLVGIPEATATVALPVPPHVGGERRVIGSSMGSTRLRVDLPYLVQLYQSGRLKLDELVTGRYPLEQINEAIASTKTGHALRNVIVFGAEYQDEEETT